MSFALEWLVSSLGYQGYYFQRPFRGRASSIFKGIWRLLQTLSYIQPKKMPNKLSTCSLEDANGMIDETVTNRALASGVVPFYTKPWEIWSQQQHSLTSHCVFRGIFFIFQNLPNKDFYQVGRLLIDVKLSEMSSCLSSTLTMAWGSSGGKIKNALSLQSVLGGGGAEVMDSISFRPLSSSSPGNIAGDLTDFR